MGELREQGEVCARWLLNEQDAQSGGWAQAEGYAPNSLNTAEALLALLAVNGDVVKVSDAAIKRGAGYLEQHQCDGGPNRGAWQREVRATPEPGVVSVPDVVRTSFSLQALVAAGSATTDDSIAVGVEWLAGVQRVDGSWGFADDVQHRFLPTCAAATALAAVTRAAHDAASVDVGDTSSRATQFILDQQHPNGSFGSDPLIAAHTTQAALALQSTRLAGLPLPAGPEHRAVRWLLAHPDEASRLISEEVVLDGTAPAHNYQFLHMSHALLLRVLSRSPDTAAQNSDLATDALKTLRDKTDDAGGCYGERIFTWSTAKAIPALVDADAQRPTFPPRSIEATGVPGHRVGHYLLGLGVLVLGGMVVLSISDDFGTAQVVVVGAVILAVLVGYGVIGEKTFKELWTATFGRGSDSVTNDGDAA